jgi:hypothetical protein
MLSIMLAASPTAEDVTLEQNARATVVKEAGSVRLYGEHRPNLAPPTLSISHASLRPLSVSGRPCPLKFTIVAPLSLQSYLH